MVKFCIRKAFAFIEETQLKQKRINISFDRELNSGVGIFVAIQVMFSTEILPKRT